ncbi:hypothetical protein ACOSQ4_024536 [Xanthoceras sorbifolium]
MLFTLLVSLLLLLLPFIGRRSFVSYGIYGQQTSGGRVKVVRKRTSNGRAVVLREERRKGDEAMSGRVVMAPIQFEPGDLNRTGGFEPEPKVQFKTSSKTRTAGPGFGWP